MKVIVDACVWSLSLRRRDQALISPAERKLVLDLRDAITDERAVLHGPIRQEVLSGIRDKREFARVEDLLEPFLDEPIETSESIEAPRSSIYAGIAGFNTARSLSSFARLPHEIVSGF